MASRRTGIAAVQPLKEAAMRAAGAARPGAQPRAPVRTMGGAFAAVSRRSGSPAPAGALAALIGRNMQAHTVVAPPARAEPCRAPTLGISERERHLEALRTQPSVGRGIRACAATLTAAAGLSALATHGAWWLQ